ncbi:MAG TPA: HAD family hydrolase [Syntrophorhabdaceae bacterium]|jgi:phosphoglycolate phosphatase|nr:HAD family hydrolase [Syntrophorhabdaceae bacterium]
MFFKGAIFDFDGTLTELTLDFDLLRAEIEAIALRYVTEDVILSLKNHYILEMIDEIERLLDGRNAPFTHEASTRLRDLEVEASKGKDVYPYTRDVLQRLKDRDISIGIITRSCIDVLRTVFPDIDSYTDSIVTREDTKYVKPNPLHVIEVLRRFRLEPDDVVMVGDHPTDIIAGKALGMRTVGVLTGRTTRGSFENVQATFIFNDIRDIFTLT